MQDLDQEKTKAWREQQFEGFFGLPLGPILYVTPDLADLVVQNPRQIAQGADLCFELL